MILIHTSECLCSMLSNNILHNLLEASMQGRMWGTPSSINPTSHWHEHNWWWVAAWCCSLYKMLQQQHLYLLSHNINASTKKNIFLEKRLFMTVAFKQAITKYSLNSCFSYCCSCCIWLEPTLWQQNLERCVWADCSKSVLRYLSVILIFIVK